MRPKRTNRHTTAVLQTTTPSSNDDLRVGDLTLAEFLGKYRIPRDKFEATGLEWSELAKIYEMHRTHAPTLMPTAQQITERLRTIPEAHSLKFRIKDPEHLLEKIIRKVTAKPDTKFAIDNYRNHITDLIGVRVLHLFKDDWSVIHDFVCREWNLQERPTANIRRGDPEELIESYRARDCKIKEHKLGYRSVHYVVRSSPTKETQIAEIQVRTIFEEGWSEIDHAIRYPVNMADIHASRMLGVLNRMAGGADEVGSCLRHLQSEMSRRRSMIGQQEQALNDAIQTIERFSIPNSIRDRAKALMKTVSSLGEFKPDDRERLQDTVEWIARREQDLSYHAADWVRSQNEINGSTRAHVVCGAYYGTRSKVELIELGALVTISQVEDGGLDVFDLAQERVGRLQNQTPLDYDAYVNAMKLVFGAFPWRARVIRSTKWAKRSLGKLMWLEVELETQPISSAPMHLPARTSKRTGGLRSRRKAGAKNVGSDS